MVRTSVFRFRGTYESTPSLKLLCRNKQDIKEVRAWHRAHVYCVCVYENSAVLNIVQLLGNKSIL